MLAQTMPAVASRGMNRSRLPVPEKWASAAPLKKDTADASVGISEVQSRSKENKTASVGPAKARSLLGSRKVSGAEAGPETALQNRAGSGKAVSATRLRLRSRRSALRTGLHVDASSPNDGDDGSGSGSDVTSAAQATDFEPVSVQTVSLDNETSFSDDVDSDWEPLTHEEKAALPLKRRSSDCASVIADLSFDINDAVADFEETNGLDDEDTSFADHPDWEPLSWEEARSLFKHLRGPSTPDEEGYLARANAELKRAARERNAEKRARRRAEAQKEVPAGMVASEIERVMADCYRLSREIAQCDELFEKVL
ncbi:hypothetical protein EVG20_g3284 [Dentipellis fragilis]|uniref:Uncharacterized protein n=1 Tax=Dentipellis fragilis TaxID=205917 RepID=A0A4Y9Z517_9AGAM|nr:hypothetical protein EVG20_g3284 [Dentipellis fragilis]